MADRIGPGWRKRGLLFRPEGQGGWMNSHAQVPTALVLEDGRFAFLRLEYVRKPG